MPKFIGVTGGSGSGKTLASTQIEKKFGPRTIAISLDRFYQHRPDKTLDERAVNNYDVPEAIDFEMAIGIMQALKNGEKVTLPGYIFSTHLRNELNEVTNDPHDISKSYELDPSLYDNIVMEGILVLSDLLTDQPKLAKFFDLPVYVDAEEVYCFIRRQKRDVLDRGRTWDSVSDQYLATVHHAFKQHTLPVKNLPGVLVVTNNGAKESMDMLPVFVAIYNLSAEVKLDINDTKALQAAGLITKLVINYVHFYYINPDTSYRKQAFEFGR
jgi:uridine kinase